MREKQKKNSRWNGKHPTAFRILKNWYKIFRIGVKKRHRQFLGARGHSSAQASSRCPCLAQQIGVAACVIARVQHSTPVSIVAERHQKFLCARGYSSAQASSRCPCLAQQIGVAARVIARVQHSTPVSTVAERHQRFLFFPYSSC